jgi:multiple sugar transport system substrate-binding protein
MTKALWQLWMAVALPSGLAAGCASEGGPMMPAEAEVTIKFLRHDNPNYEKADKAFFAEYMALHPNVHIADETVEYQSLSLILNGNLKHDQFAYDLVLIPPSLVCGFAANLDDVPEDVLTLPVAQNTFFAAPLAGSTCGGKLKGLPVEYNLEYGGVVVNLDKYQTKFPGKTPGWTDWNQFIAEASTLSEFDDSGKPMANGLDIAAEWPEPVKHLFLSQILQRGGSYWSSTGNTFDFSTQAARDSLAEMVKWLRVDRVMFPELIPDKNTSVPGRLAAGATGFGWGELGKPLSVMGYLGTWGVPSTVGQMPAGSSWRYDFYTLPPMVGDKHKFIQNSGWAFAVPRTSPNKKVAWDVARSLALSPDAMRKWSAVTGALPALRVNATPAAADASPTLQKVHALLEHGQWVGYIPAAANDTALFAMVNNFFAAAAGEKTIEQALADMQETANSAIRLHAGN